MKVIRDKCLNCEREFSMYLKGAPLKGRARLLVCGNQLCPFFNKRVPLVRLEKHVRDN